MVRILKLQKKGYPLQSNQFDQVKYCCIFQHVAYTETDALGQSALLQVLFKPNRKKKRFTQTVISFHRLSLSLSNYFIFFEPKILNQGQAQYGPS